MSNEKYSFLDRGYQNPLRKNYDPVLDFRDMVVNMRNLQTHFNTKGGEQNLFDAIEAESLEHAASCIKQGFEKKRPTLIVVRENSPWLDR